MERDTSYLESKNESLYTILGVKVNASQNEIKAAFRKKAKISHPDKGGDTRTYALIRKAYEVLTNEDSRAFYDSTGKLEKKTEEEFEEMFRKKGEKKRKENKRKIIKENGAEKESELEDEDEDSDKLNVFNSKITSAKDKNFSSGFEDWCRSRNLTHSVIDDDYLIQKLGVAKVSYECRKHKIRHPTMSIIIKESALNDSSSKISDRLSLDRSILTNELLWGEVLVNFKYSSISHYSLTMIRLSEDILGSYDQFGSTYEHEVNDKKKKDLNFFNSSGLGVVECVGPGVKELREGDWVIPINDFVSCLKVACIIDEKQLMLLPSHIIPLEYTAVIKEIFLAYYLLERFSYKLLPGEWIILNSANSLVGQTLIQFAKLLNLNSIAIIRYENEESFKQISQYLLDLGASQVYSANDSILNKLQKQNIAMPKVAYDAVGGLAAPTKLISILQEGGTLVSYGSLSKENFQIPWHLFISRGITIKSFWLNKFLKSAKNQKIMIETLQIIGKLLNEKKIVVNLKEYQLEDFKLAFDKDRTVENRIMKSVFKIPSIEEEKILWNKQVSQNQYMEEALFSKYVSPAIVDNAIKNDSSKKELRLTVVNREIEMTRRDNRKKACTIIFLHNRNEIPEEYEINFKNFLKRDEDLPNMRIVIPSAPYTVVQEDNEECLCWCEEKIDALQKNEPTGVNGLNTFSLNEKQLQFLQCIEKSCDLVCDLIVNEAKMDKNNKYILCGFGEGALVALITALTKPIQVDAIICFAFPEISLKVLKFILNKSYGQAKNSKIFLLTGSHDSVSTPDSCNATKIYLEQLGIELISCYIIPYATHDFSNAHLEHLFSMLSLI